MTQRVFDMENKQDVKDLFDILPDGVMELGKNNDQWDTPPSFYALRGQRKITINGIAVRWNQSGIVCRPVDKSKWIGCLCWMWDDDECKVLEILDKIVDAELPYIVQRGNGAVSYQNCRPVKRDEIKFVEDGE